MFARGWACTSDNRTYEAWQRLDSFRLLLADMEPLSVHRHGRS